MTTILPIGPRLTTPRLGALPLACGRHLAQAHLRPIPWSDRWKYNDIVVGIYIVTDPSGCVRWLGQANREDDLPGRLDNHHRNPAKREVFAKVRALHLHDGTPPRALDAIEGRCADLLGLREVMKPLRWPSADDWLALTA
ncbi:hypothetical protein OG848_47470 (plasmid) [Streptomyces canus]|uniref:hypothetical protein n=1 Tax=Streptomyces canus TaxID=58343 RepID=UPI002F90774F